MRKGCLIFIALFSIHYAHMAFGQEIPVSSEQQLENLADTDQSETEDDSWLQELEQYRKHPLNLNDADAEELKQLRIITGLQIDNLLSYRKLFGRLIHIYELQAVPGWDINTIKKILPFISVSSAVFLTEEIRSRLAHGEHSMLLRMTQVLEKAKGFDQSIGNKYLGSPQRVLFRYRYTYKNLLQFGIVGDKDAGEQFLKGVQKKGFDFYSFHFFAKKTGIIESLALGDFTVNMGQGLIHWQGLAFKKSAEITGLKRQSAVLRPYSSAGEFNFHRGAGVSIKKGKLETSVFISYRKLSANLITDTVEKQDYVSSFLSSGYHRTEGEVADRNQLTQAATGATINYRGDHWQTSINAVYFSFSNPVKKREEPYNLHAISGNKWYNMSIDYSYTYRNLHFFGELATDKNLNTAFINGVMISVDPRVDISFLQRHIGIAYQAVNGNAFTENTYPTNETGFFAGITIRPANSWRLDAYADIYKFPWLKYGVDAPSSGADFLAHLTYTPDKQVAIYTRFRAEFKQANLVDNASVTNNVVCQLKKNWRTQLNYKLSNAVTLRNRVELVWYGKRGLKPGTGFLFSTDLLYKPLLRPFSGGIRLQYFETEGYNSRIYAYENDVSYSYSIPAFFDKGFRYYINLNYDHGKRLSYWFRIAQTRYEESNSIGSGLDEIPGAGKTELKIQFRWLL